MTRDTFDAFDTRDVTTSSTTVSRRPRFGNATPLAVSYPALRPRPRRPFLSSKSWSVGRASTSSGRQKPGAPVTNALGTRYETRSGGKPGGTPTVRRYVSQSRSASFSVFRSSSLAHVAPPRSTSRGGKPAWGRAEGTRRGRAQVETGVAVGETRLRGAGSVVSAGSAEVPPARRFSRKESEKSADRSACASRLSCRFLTSAHPTNRARRGECSGLGEVAMRGRRGRRGGPRAATSLSAWRLRRFRDKHDGIGANLTSIPSESHSFFAFITTREPPRSPFLQRAVERSATQTSSWAANPLGECPGHRLLARARTRGRRARSPAPIPVSGRSRLV